MASWCAQGCAVFYTCMHVSSIINLHVAWQKEYTVCIVCAERNRMGGFVMAGAHMLVNLQAGNCTGIQTQTDALPTIYTHFVTPAPSETEAILPPSTSRDPALLLTLSSAVFLFYFINCNSAKPPNTILVPRFSQNKKKASCCSFAVYSTLTKLLITNLKTASHVLQSQALTNNTNVFCFSFIIMTTFCESIFALKWPQPDDTLFP